MESLPDSTIARLREAIATPDFSSTRYELVGQIGHGGMGTVYACVDRQLGRQVAIKVLHILDRDGRAASRLAEEAHILARLEHPGIVPVHDLGELPDGRIFYAMKLIEGTRLDEFSRAPRSLAELLRVFLRICETVAFAHSQGVIHRDLKPQNIMVGAFGEVLVLDWGAAQRSGITHDFRPGDGSMGSAEPGTAVGTPGYMAPEQGSGGDDEVDARSDVYSLGKTLETLLKNGGYRVPPRLHAIWRKAASAPRHQRYASATELAADIERYRIGEPVVAYRENFAEKLVRWLMRNRAMVLLAAAYLFMRVLLFFFIRR